MRAGIAHVKGVSVKSEEKHAATEGVPSPDSSLEASGSEQKIKPCACQGDSCCGPSLGELARRQFLKAAGVGFVSTALAGKGIPIMAGPFSAADTSPGHLIPADKKLSPEWLRGLSVRGAKEVFKGASLDNIGMPCGGIGAGQLYLCGDGTLGCWQIFNDEQSNWVEWTFATYKHRGIAKPLDQGFAVAIDSGDATGAVRALDREGFSDVAFNGQYPIGTVRYAQDGCPVVVEMEAFSPFIPLDAKDSGLPVTIFHITVENVSGKPVTASILGWLENGVCAAYAREFDATRTTQYVARNGYTACVHSAEAKAPTSVIASERPCIVFETFEADNFGNWIPEGPAFGTAPVRDDQSPPKKVQGVEGIGCAASFAQGDQAQGTLTSPPFVIERRYINFLIAGGRHRDKTCINLIVGGRVVRSSAGRNSSQLAWRSWSVAEWEGKEARLAIVDQMSFDWGRVAIDQVEFADAPRGEGPDPILDAADYGALALACCDPSGAGKPSSGPFPPNRPPDAFVVEESAQYDAQQSRRGLLRTNDVPLAAGEKHTFTFFLAWHFPNQKIGDRFAVTPWKEEPRTVGHAYAARFGGVLDVAGYVFEHCERLTRDTRLWRDIYYDSTLPYWLLDRLHSTASYLASGTCQWWRDGRFYAYEGVTCCSGTCTHVWNYAHTHAHLFPELARSIREMQDFCARENGGGFHADSGLVGFRSDDEYAADGQCGAVLNAYREHRMSADNSFLARNWSSIKKALEFLIVQDANEDGLIEDRQPNTYDIEYFGANTLVGSLYLAALRAAAEMATEMGDASFAKRVHRIFEKGSALTERRLWNGEYFIQDVDLAKYPKNQYKDGCLSDQLFGQTWAHQLGLGHLYAREKVGKALDAIWKYNWAPDIGPYNAVHAPFRWFITPGQAGLITCTWPKSEYLAEGTRYREEVWTGIEYQVAANMIWEGKLTEGLAICRAVHDRYRPDLFNPYNEVECGDHYARAMASWGVYLALGGFQYHGPKRWLGFAPRLSPEDFRATFTTAEGWVTLQQKRTSGEQTNSIEVRWGALRLARFSIETRGRVRDIGLSVNGRPIKAKAHTTGETTTLEFHEAIVLEAGGKLEVRAAG